MYFFTVNLITISATAGWSWTSPILPKLASTDTSVNPLPRPITTLEESWIASAMNVGTIIGGLFAGILSERFGKKNTILVFSIPVILGHILCAVAFNVEIFIVARLLMGISLGMVFGVIPSYVSDIAEVENRGSLGSVLGVCNSFGILAMFVIGPFLSVRVFSIVNLIVPVLFFIVFGLFAPDSPYDLIKHGQYFKAEAALVKLRNRTKAEVQKELLHISQGVQSASLGSQGLSMLFKNKTSLKGLAISNSLMFFQQFSGTIPIVAYMQIIFQGTGSSVSPTYSAMIIGLVRLISNIASSQLIEKLGRKLLLNISYIFCIVSLTSLGTYFLIPYPSLDWLPMASLILYMIAFNLGLANIPWVMTAELFPSHLKSAALAISSFFCFLLSFIVNISFPLIEKTLGMTVIFWTFAVSCLVGLIVCITVYFETKGKSIEEIQTLLEGKKK